MTVLVAGSMFGLGISFRQVDFGWHQDWLLCDFGLDSVTLNCLEEGLVFHTYTCTRTRVYAHTRTLTLFSFKIYSKLQNIRSY